MSISSSQRPAGIAGRIARQRPRRRDGGPAPAGPSPAEYNERPRAVPDLPDESVTDHVWDERVARELRHQEVIDASFDRAEAYERLGDFEHALEWLDRAVAVSGDLPAAYRARRERWARAAAVQLRPAGGHWQNGRARAVEGGAGR
jgi:tetratricopeptide (TPR) repeat protein